MSSGRVPRDCPSTPMKYFRILRSRVAALSAYRRTHTPTHPHTYTLTLLLALSLAPVCAQDEAVPIDVRLAVDLARIDARKLRPADTQAAGAVLKERLTVLSAEPGGQVDARAPEDIRVRVTAPKLAPSQLRLFSRTGRLELRHLDDLQTALKPKGRYLLEVYTVQQKRVIRFRDQRSREIVSAEKFLSGSPLVASGEDLLPGSARVVGDTGFATVRIRLKQAGSRRLDRFGREPGRMLAIVLDGEILGLTAVSQKPEKRKDRKLDLDDAPSEVDIAAGFSTEAEARWLAVVLNSGPLPFPLTVTSPRLPAP